jgi:hypothetical protein
MNGINPKILNVLAKQQADLAKKCPDGKPSIFNINFLLGIIFYPNEDGDVTDIQADIIGPRKYFFDLFTFFVVDRPNTI